MSIGLLGLLEIDGGAQLEPRDRIALSVLAVRHGRAVAPDELADALWTGSPPTTWQKQVQICIARLRKALGASAIETVAGGYRLALDGDALDTVRFERLTERGRAFEATGDPTRAASAYTRALELWRGHPFEELDGWASGRSEAARLEELRRTVEEDLLEARLDVGDHRRVAGRGRGARRRAAVAGEALGDPGAGALSLRSPGRRAAVDPDRPAHAGRAARPRGEP